MNWVDELKKDAGMDIKEIVTMKLEAKRIKINFMRQELKDWREKGDALIKEVYKTEDEEKRLQACLDVLIEIEENDNA